MSAGGLRVLVLSNMYPGEDDPDFGAFVAVMAAALERHGATVRVEAIDTRAHGALRTPAKYASLARRAARAAREVDVVYAHYLFPTGAIAAEARRVGGAPWVVTAHGRDVRNLGRAGIRKATARSLAGASALIAVSEHLAGALRSSGLALPPLHVINMGVDLDRFRPRPRGEARRRLGLPSDGPLVLAVGGLTARKNPLTLLQAFRRVRDRRPGARLALVGDGPLRTAVTAGIDRLHLGSSVVCAGAVAPAGVPDWIAASDALAMVSTVEPLGVVALEALASGRPVVATRVGGAAEVVPPSGPGRVVDPRDPAAIAEALDALLDEPPAPDICRRYAAPHGVDRQAERVLAVLGAAAQEPPGR